MDSFGYKLFFLLHILTVIVAFAPAFVWPVVSVTLKKQQKPVGPAIGALAAGNTAKVHGPALVLAGFFGFGLIGMSDKVWEFSQSWISVAMLLWFIMMGVLFGMMLPAEKKAAALPPKLTVPMILFFLPVLFAVILGPAGIQVSQRGIFPNQQQ